MGKKKMQFWYDVEIVIPEVRAFTPTEIANQRTADGKDLFIKATAINTILN